MGHKKGAANIWVASAQPLFRHVEQVVAYLQFEVRARAGLLEVVRVQVAVAASPDEVAHLQACLLRQHVGQQRRRC